MNAACSLKGAGHKTGLSDYQLFHHKANDWYLRLTNVILFLINIFCNVSVRYHRHRYCVPLTSVSISIHAIRKDLNKLNEAFKQVLKYSLFCYIMWTVLDVSVGNFDDKACD